ncbi:MAG: hypothetical protein AAF408_16635, partial [Pseudomonadota bacterium]
AAESVTETTARAAKQAVFAVESALAEQKVSLEFASVEAGEVIEALDAAIDKLREFDLEIEPEIPRGDTEKLLVDAPALLERLRMEPVDEKDVEDARRKVLPAVRGHATTLLDTHHKAMVNEVNDKIYDCQFRARQAEIELDPRRINDVKVDIAKFTEYRDNDIVGTKHLFLQSLFNLEEPVIYAEASKATLKAKLPQADDDIAEHAGVCGGLDRVREIAKGLKPGRLVNLGIGPMAIVSDNFNFADNPTPEVVEADGSFSLKSVTVTNSSSHSCTIMPIGEFSLGKIVSTLDGVVQVSPESGEGETVDYRGLNPSAGWSGKILKRAVSPETYKELEKRELEHLIDFEYAFQLGPGALGAAINKVSGKSFETREGPIDALIAALKKAKSVTLVPRDPYDPGAWSARMAAVLAHLSDGSKERDRQGTHSPSGNVPVPSGNSIVITPIFKEASLDMATIITLDKAPAVYGDAAASDELAEPVEIIELVRGDSMALSETFATIDLFDGVDGTEVLTLSLDAGRSVQVETEADSAGEAWISFEFDFPELAGEKLSDSPRAYAKVPASKLK